MFVHLCIKYLVIIKFLDAQLLNSDDVVHRTLLYKSIGCGFKSESFL